MAAAAVARATSLPDDVVREILVRVDDAADLFRCAVTCKRWRHLVAKGSFLGLRRRWPLSGFFMWNFIRRGGSSWLGHRSFVPTRRSVFGSEHASLESFLPPSLRGRLVMPLTTRRGLILVNLNKPYSPEGTIDLAVCNSLTGACYELPPQECPCDFGGYAILTGEDRSWNAKQRLSVPSGYSALFKVLIIGNENYMDQRTHSLHMFTSGEPTWSMMCTPISLPEEQRIGCLQPMHRHAVVWRGTAHWLVQHVDSSWCTLNVDVETCHISVTKIGNTIKHMTPQSYDEPRLTVAADGKLSLLYMQRRGFQLEIWTRKEDGGPTRWLRTMVVELKPPNPRRTAMHLIILGEKGGMLLIKDNHGNVYAAHLKTGEMEKFMVLDKINRRQVVPFEMDWPAFFVSRLGTR